MRSIFLDSLIFALPLALAGGLVLGACASDESDALAEQAPRDEGGFSQGEPPTTATSDAAAGPNAKPTRGSPLCGVTADTCVPDDDGTASTPFASCATAPDASAPALDASDPSAPEEVKANACRLRDVGGSYAPVCLRADDGQGSSPRGLDGARCEQGTDCAPGFDCVDGEMGAVCRRYCCMGTCEGHSARSGGPTFCDVQKLVDPAPHLAPVCMPIKPCKLLGEGECGPTETCAIVTDKGVTACVARGTAKVGESCDEEHCVADLNCLGNAGSRRCYKLCKMTRSGSDCPSSQTCTTGSLFQDNTFGVCKDL